MYLVQTKHPEILAGIGEGYRKSEFRRGVQKLYNISETWQSRSRTKVTEDQ